MKAKYVISNTNVDKCPDHDAPEYAFIGRSNVGKSSLINMLTRHKGLAKTSQTPGKTLLINHFSIDDDKWWIVDLPGYGFASRGHQQRKEIQRIIESYILRRRQMNCLFLLIDIRHKPQKIDVEFMTWLGEHEVPFAIVFTKSDKLSATAAERSVADYKKELRKTWEELPPIFITSSEKHKGRDEILDFIERENRRHNADLKALAAEVKEEKVSPDTDVASAENS